MMLRPIENLSRLAALLCGYAYLGLCFLIGFEILARRFLHFSLQGVDEIGGYVLAITVAFGFGYALIQGSHTRIDILLMYLGERGRAICNFLALLGIAVFASFMAWRAWDTLRETLEFDSLASTPLQTPLWIPQTLWVAGLALFALIAIGGAVHGAILLARRPAQFNNVYGPPSLQSEIDEQMSTLEESTVLPVEQGRTA
ncbi:TRAP transporter small permease subunit [Microvirga massiliensis]|uniref:TRAP transporter small permease subunit n=1 Tax=Microvirga massiliensis TaxID=1033741 RepID=UPI000660429D|nr:TRAP transporter small permease [Microvirga massiliensis]